MNEDMWYYIWLFLTQFFSKKFDFFTDKWQVAPGLLLIGKVVSPFLSSLAFLKLAFLKDLMGKEIKQIIWVCCSWSSGKSIFFFFACDILLLGVVLPNPSYHLIYKPLKAQIRMWVYDKVIMGDRWTLGKRVMV